MRLSKTLALAAVASLSLMAGTAHAVTFVLNSTPNNNGNNVSAQADISAVGDHVTLRVTNTTQNMVASNQAISDVSLNFTTNVGGVTNFTQSGQRGTIDANGNATNISGAPTRWDASNPGGTTYLDVIGGGQPSEMIASNSLGIPNAGFDNFNPYVLGDIVFEFDLVGASNLQLTDLLFSFGTNHEFIGHGVCIANCGVINPTGGPVPEPASWALMIMGFGGMGAVLRRKRALAQRAYA
jgi:hypothetical protein